MKRFIALLMAIMMVFALAACGGAPSDNADTSGDKEQKGEEVVKNSGEGQLGDYYVKITGYELAEDYDGNPVIIINYDFTNNSEETTSAAFATVFELFQNGVQLETAFLMDYPEGYNGDNYMKDIRPGTTISVSQDFVLEDASSEVEVEVTEFVSFNDDMITYVIELGE